MLSKLSLEDIKIPVLIAGTAFTTASAILSFYIYRKYVSTMDYKWEEAGEVSHLLIHPVKSARSIEVKRAFASKNGLSNGNILDRSFIILSGDDMVTGRDRPILVTISPKIVGQTLTLTSIDGRKFSVDIDNVVSESVTVKFKIRCSTVQGLDCGKDVGKWLGSVLNMESKQVRLIFRGFYEWSRPLRKFSVKFHKMRRNDVTVYQDSASYMVMTKSSIDDLNTRLETPVDVHYFRPPILIKGTAAYDEDNWSYIKIGKSVILRVFKPCERCLLTQRVPTTGEIRTDHFAVLESYRTLSWPANFAKKMAHKPILGVHCGIDSVGEIAVGDKVYISRQESPWWKIG